MPKPHHFTPEQIKERARRERLLYIFANGLCTEPLSDDVPPCACGAKRSSREAANYGGVCEDCWAWGYRTVHSKPPRLYESHRGGIDV